MQRFAEPRPTRGEWVASWLLPLALLLLLLIGATFRSSAQATITRAEYFVDADPGLGAATAITLPATPAADLPSLSASVPLSALAPGFHQLGIRSQDSNGQWSLTSRRTFYYEPAALAALANITKVEYFVDTDPGFGAATNVPVTAGTDLSGVAFSVPLATLNAGFHELGVRSQDANGQWSLTNRRTFYYEPAALNALPNITKAEYFIDTDPGFGTATDIPIATPAADLGGLGFTVNISSLPAGFHELGLRSQDANGKWSLTSRRMFYYEPAALNALANINKVEYFLDADPGFGAGTDVPITPGTDVSGVNIAVPLSALPAGFHQLSVRSRDANGKWSLTNVRTFYYEPVLAVAPNINKVEYYFDTDPGFGSATNVPVPTPAPDLANFSFAADASALADGPHLLFIRSRDAAGKWSLVSNRAFVKNGCASSQNLAAGLPAASYTVGGSVGNTPALAFNTDPAVPNTSNAVYMYNGSTIQADLGSPQSISEVRARFTTPGTPTNFTLEIQTATSLAGPFTTVDTYTATFNANTSYPVTRTLATPATGVRVLRLLVQNTGGNYTQVTGVGGYYFNCASPSITSFTPSGGGAGTSVTLTGTNLSGATAVTFNGIAAVTSTITGNTSTGLTVTAPAGGTTGPICVTTPAGTACSAGSFQYPPAIATGTVSPTAFCSSTFIQVPFSTNVAQYGVGNQFKFQLSDASGNFTAGSRLYGTLLSQNASGGILQDTVAFRTPAGTGYRVRVVASNPAITGTDNGTNLTIYPTPAATASANSPVVFNGTIQLVAQPAGQPTYSWFVAYNAGGTAFVGSGQTLNLPNAQPTQSGKYYVIVNNTNGCQDSASVRVLVQPNAVPVLTMGQFGFNGCAGATFNVGFTVSGNNFANGNTISAQLSDANGSFAAPTVIGSAAFTGQGSGAISVTIPTNTPTGTGYRVRLVADNPAVTSTTDNGSNMSITTQPTATAGSNSPVAFNGTIQLTAQAVAGASYFWTGPGFSSNQQNPTIANATTGNSGTYTLYVTVNGCQSPGSAIAVVVNPSAQPILAIAQFGGTLCPGTNLSIGFSVTGNGFGSGNVITAQLSDASGSFASPVNIGVVGFVGQGSGGISATIPQTTTAGTGYRIRLVADNPAVTSTSDNGTNLNVPVTLVATASSNSPVASGGTLQLNAGPNGAASYQWTVAYTAGGTALISNQQNPSFNNVTTASSGVYTVTVTQGGCQNTASTSVIVNAPVVTTLALDTFSGQFCAGSAYGVNYTVGGAGLSSGTITAQLSDATGSFASPVNIGSTAFNGTGSGSLGVIIPGTTADGTAYRIRLVSTSPALTSNDNGTNMTLSNLTGVTASSNSPVAAGATITFSSAGIPAGASIAWSGPNSFSSSQPNPTINNANASNAGAYLLTVGYNGCTVLRQVQLVVGQPTVVLATGTVNGSFCPGSPLSVPYSVTTGSVNGGNTFTVQLSDATGSFAAPVNIGSLASSAGTGTIAALIPAGTPAGTAYRVRVVASSPAIVGSDNGSNLTVGPLTFAWTGGVSTDWFNAANWSCGQVPGATSVVTIPSGAAFYPVITGSTAALALNLTVQNGAFFTNNGLFNLYGNVTVNGTTQGNATSVWSFVGTGSQFIFGTSALQVGNLFINAGSILTMNNGLNVSANWYNNGGFLGAAAYTVAFNGTGGTQLIGGSSVTTFYNLAVSGGAVVNLAINTIFLGNMTSTGTFNAMGFGVAFNGPAAQSIGGSGATFYTVTINNGVGVSLVSNITVLGNWINNGQFSGGTFSVTFAGTVAQIIGGTQVSNFYNVTFNNPISVTLNQNIFVLGSFANTGVFYGYNVVGSVTNGYFVRFAGSAAQVITANVTTYFYHFYVDNAAGVRLATNIYITGNYYLFSGSFAPGTFTVFFNGTGGVVQTVGGYTALNFYAWNIASGSFVRLIQNVTLLGSFANAGTFYGYDLVGSTYTGYTLVFGGSSAQSISGGGVYEFWHVTWNNLAGITLNQNISVWGNWLNSGGYLANGFLVSFIGNAAQTIGGAVSTTFHHISISNPVSVTLNQPIVVLGNWGGTGVFLGNTFLVSFNGTAAQTIATGSSTRFFNLRFNNPVSVTLLSSIFLNGNWTNDGGFLANGRLVTFSGSALQLIGGSVATVFHHFTIATGATVQQNLGLTLLGDWTNNGTFLPNNLLVAFTGTVLQTIAGTALSTFYDVTFNNAVNVSLGQNIDVMHNFLNQGGYCGCGFRTRFSGAVVQTISSSSNRTHFHDLTFANAAGVTLLDGIFVSGLWVNNGGFLANSQTVTFDGSALQSIAGSVLSAFYNVGITNAVNVQLLRDITVAGFWNNTGLFDGNGFLVTFNGTALQTITTTGALARTTFHHVTWANLVGCTLAGDVYVRGNWLCNAPFNPATYTVYFTGTVAQSMGGSTQVRFFGLNVSNTVGLTCTGPVFLAGNFVNTGLVNCGTFAWTCNGTAAQTIGGVSLTPTRFYDLIMLNGSGVTATDNFFLTHVLTLTTGNLASNGHLTLTSNATGTAMVVNPAGGGIVTGRATMERFITGLGGAPGYRHYSSPMKLSAGAISTTMQEFA
ncbi:MAG: C-terminal target protein, partial [Hymenobacter sp.]|nr:C-terminal target protein [Hymenobacter sp.]